MPRLCFLGPMLGLSRGYVTSQGLVLSSRFDEAGYEVWRASSIRNRAARLLDVLGTVIRRSARTDIQCLEVYGGLSFVGEDAASWLGQRLNHRVVMVVHGGAMPEFMRRFPAWTARVLQRADVIVTPSEYLARALRHAGHTVTVIPNCIDLPRYPFRLRAKVQPRLLWMRTFHPVWNPILAVRVLARLRKEFPNASLVMAGQDKGMLAATRECACDLGVAGSVRFPGFLDMAGKSREGAAADIFLNTNRVDNMPVAIVEAQAMGLPVISTDVGGIRDLVKDGETGLLVPSDDEQAMAAAVRRLVQTEALAASLSENGHRFAALCSWENVRPQWERLFRSLK